MASLKDLRNRIASVTATRKITKAMQMVAAAKLRRAQDAVQAARPYAERMDAVMTDLSRAVTSTEGASKLMVGTGKTDVHLLLVMTAERGLCGGFNSNIARKARADIVRLVKDGKTVKIFCVGKKGSDVLKREFAAQIIDLIDLRAVKVMGYTNAEEIGNRVLTMYDNGEFDVCTMYYSKFVSVMTQVPTGQQLIPSQVSDDAPAAGDKTEAKTDAKKTVAKAVDAYDYEPSEEEVLDFLLQRNVSTQVFRALLENGASEQGSRMTAMDSATRNAGEMIDALTLTYNRQRQAQITKELIEIISGAEAL